jgi:hypothetical protein
MADWLVPTFRATSWRPLVGVAVALAAAGGLVLAFERATVSLLGIGAAALSAALVAGLRDPAAALLAAMPTSNAHRRARRLVLLVPAGLALWLAYVWVSNLADPAVGWPVGPAIALSATGLGVATWAPERIRVEVGVAAPLLWYAVARTTAEVDGIAGDVLAGWHQHPWLVTAAAGAALVIGRNR